MYALKTDTCDPTFNLALEEVLFHSLSEENKGLFLLWRNSPSIIIGRHQNTSEEVNESYCREHKIEIVRRSTGGGAVYHDLGNLNFSFMQYAEGTAITGFECFMLPMIEALKDLNVHARFTGRNDILVDGKKICGTAQRRDGRRILHHGCLLVDTDTEVLSSALKGDPRKYLSKGVSSYRSRVANLREFLPPSLSTYECMELVEQTLLRHCAEELRGIPDELISEAENLADKRYRTWEWNWGSSPAYNKRKKEKFPWGWLDIRLSVDSGIIRDCMIHGDFFSSRDLSELTATLKNCPFNAPSLETVLTEIPLESFFTGSSRQELSDFFLSFFG